MAVLCLLQSTMPVQSECIFENLAFERISLTPGETIGHINCMLQDHQGFMWFGTPGGLARYDGYGSTFYKYRVSDTTSLSGDNILCLYEDRSGALWVGTMIHGLNRFDRQTGKFHRFVHDPNNPRSLLSNQVYAIYEDRSGTLWVGTAYGFHRYDGPQEGFTRFLVDSKPPDSLALRNSTKAFCEDREGRFWVGTIGGLYRFDRAGKPPVKFTRNPDDPHSISANSVTNIIEDESGNLWLSTVGGGLNYFDRHKNQFTRFTHDPNHPGSISNNVVWAILIDHHGNLWAGTEGGLNILDRQTGQFTRLVSDRDNSHSIGSNYITSLVEDRGGAIWVSSGSLWGRGRGSGFGIDKWDPGQAQFRLSYGEPCITRGGEMIFGGGGLNIFHPDSIRDNPHIPPVWFTRFTRYRSDDAGGKIIVDNEIAEKPQIELTRFDRTLTIDFTALNYRNAAKNHYAYRLEGAQDEWIFLGTQRSITFTNLAPGNYTLHVKGANNDGIWNEQGVSLQLIVLPPWWRTWWAYLLYGMFALGTLYALHRYVLNRQQLKYELELGQLGVNNLIAQRRRLQERFRRELTVNPSEITVTSMDEAFLSKVIAVVESHIDAPAFDTDVLAREAGISRRHLNRKLRALTGQSVREFIRTVRLKRAAQLLQQQAGSVTEIAYEVGFLSIAHFAKRFREQFGVAPSEFGKRK